MLLLIAQVLEKPKECGGGGGGVMIVGAAVCEGRLREVPCVVWAHGRGRDSRARRLSVREEDATAERDLTLPCGRQASSEAEAEE